MEKQEYTRIDNGVSPAQEYFIEVRPADFIECKSYLNDKFKTAKIPLLHFKNRKTLMDALGILAAKKVTIVNTEGL